MAKDPIKKFLTADDFEEEIELACKIEKQLVWTEEMIKVLIGLYPAYGCRLFLDAGWGKNQYAVLYQARKVNVKFPRGRMPQPYPQSLVTKLKAMKDQNG